MIRELFDVVKIIGQIQNSKANQNVKDSINTLNNNKDLLSKLIGKSNSIARMASKRIYNYPVVISNAFGDNIETAFKILKYAESAFAYFLTISIGLEPVVNKDKTLSMHLSQFSSEQVDLNALDSMNPRIALRFTEESVWEVVPLENLYEKNSQVYVSSKEKIGKHDINYNFSQEDVLDRIKYEETTTYKPWVMEVEPQENTGEFFEVNTGRRVDEDGYYIDRNGYQLLDGKGNPILCKGEIREGVLKYASDVDTKQKDLEVPSAAFNKFHESVEKRIGKSLPTSVTVDLYVGEHRIPISLAVKAIPHFIDSVEMKGMFKRCVEGERILSKIIRLRTGEISFFKDFLFNWKDIKEDQEFFQKMGRHPWYRKLLDKKINSTAKGIFGLINSLKNLLKDQNVLPTVTLVTTVNEISDAISFPYFDAVKRGKVQKILDSLMLLALIVYDQDRDVIHCHFNGIPHPYIIPIKDLSHKNEQDTMISLIESMGKLMMRSY